jgi:hypothetical protein
LLLRNIVLEICKYNNIQQSLAFKKFFKDVEEQYDVKLGFERKSEEMQNALSKAKQDLHAISLECSSLKDVHEEVKELFQYGGI